MVISPVRRLLSEISRRRAGSTTPAVPLPRPPCWPPALVQWVGLGSSPPGMPTWSGSPPCLRAGSFS